MKVRDADMRVRESFYLRDKIEILTYFLKLAFLILNNLMYLCARNDRVKMVSRSFRILFESRFNYGDE